MGKKIVVRLDLTDKTKKYIDELEKLYALGGYNIDDIDLKLLIKKMRFNCELTIE